MYNIFDGFYFLEDFFFPVAGLALDADPWAFPFPVAFDADLFFERLEVATFVFEDFGFERLEAAIFAFEDLGFERPEAATFVFEDFEEACFFADLEAYLLPPLVDDFDFDFEYRPLVLDDFPADLELCLPGFSLSGPNVGFASGFGVLAAGLYSFFMICRHCSCSSRRGSPVCC